MILEEFDLETVLINNVLWQSTGFPFWLRVLWFLLIFGLIAFLVYILIQKGKEEVSKELRKVGIGYDEETREELFGTYPEYVLEGKLTFKDISESVRKWIWRLIKFIWSLLEKYLFPRTRILLISLTVKLQELLLEAEEEKKEKRKEKEEEQERISGVLSQVLQEGLDLAHEFFQALTVVVLLSEKGFSVYEKEYRKGPPHLELEKEKEKALEVDLRPASYLEHLRRQQALKRWLRYFRIFLRTRFVLLWASFRRFLRRSLLRWGVFRFFYRLKFKAPSPSRFFRNVKHLGSRVRETSKKWSKRGFSALTGFLRLQILKALKSLLAKAGKVAADGLGLLRDFAEFGGLLLRRGFRKMAIYGSAITLATLVAFIVFTGGFLLFIMSMLAIVDEGLGGVQTAASLNRPRTALETLKESQFLDLDATLEGNPSSVRGGDILTYRVTITAKAQNVHGLRVINRVEFQEQTKTDTRYFLDRNFPDDSTAGYQIVPGFPEPIARPVSVGGRGVQLVWEVPFLGVGESVSFRYRTRVHEDYDASMDGPICVAVEALAVEDEVGPINICANSEGMVTLAGWAERLSDCLTKSSNGEYNQYDPDCAYLSDCDQALVQFAASHSIFGEVTCVNFVVGAMKCAGVAPPHAGDAGTWYNAYKNQSRFLVYANGTEPPQRGDLVVLSGGAEGYGHIGVILYVDNYELRYAHSNMSTLFGELAINNGKVESPPGFEVLGFIRVL